MVCEHEYMNIHPRHLSCLATALSPLLIKNTVYMLLCLFKQCFVESKTAWQHGIFAQNTLVSADFCIKNNSNALSEFLKSEMGLEQVIKLI